MKRSIIGLAGVLALSGCASTAPSPALSGFDQVELEPWVYGAQAVTGVSFSYALQAPANNELGFCVAQHVSNRQVNVKDQSSSFYGAYTGNYYHVERSRSIDGGEVMMYASQDGKSVAAQGSAIYQIKFMTLVDKAVRFSLAVEERGGNVNYKFSNIEVAQLSTGVVHNEGFSRLGAHKQAYPEAALSALKDISQKIQRCL